MATEVVILALSGIHFWQSACNSLVHSQDSCSREYVQAGGRYGCAIELAVGLTGWCVRNSSAMHTLTGGLCWAIPLEGLPCCAVAPP